MEITITIKMGKHLICVLSKCCANGTGQNCRVGFRKLDLKVQVKLRETFSLIFNFIKPNYSHDVLKKIISRAHNFIFHKCLFFRRNTRMMPI